MKHHSKNTPSTMSIRFLDTDWNIYTYNSLRDRPSGTCEVCAYTSCQGHSLEPLQQLPAHEGLHSHLQLLQGQPADETEELKLKKNGIKPPAFPIYPQEGWK